jgi:hypothetical protein
MARTGQRPPITDGKNKPMPSNDVQGQTPSTPSAGGPIVPKKTKTPALTDAQERKAALANASGKSRFFST